MIMICGFVKLATLLQKIHQKFLQSLSPLCQSPCYCRKMYSLITKKVSHSTPKLFVIGNFVIIKCAEIILFGFPQNDHSVFPFILFIVYFF